MSPYAKIRIVPCLSDNYAYLIHDPQTLATACIDAPEAEPIKNALEQEGWVLTDILITHHHHDHVGGVGELKESYGCRVVAPYDKLVPIHEVDVRVREGDALTIGFLPVRILETPGHTLEHLTYVLDSEKAFFTGDTLFSGGCGRVFEGTYGMMWDSLQKLKQLPAGYLLYCGHEYTAINLAFCQSIEKDNQDLKARKEAVTRLRAQGEATIPVALGTEKKTNVFLRANESSIASSLELSGSGPVRVFGSLRDLRNNF